MQKWLEDQWAKAGIAPDWEARDRIMIKHIKANQPNFYKKLQDEGMVEVFLRGKPLEGDE